MGEKKRLRSVLDIVKKHGASALHISGVLFVLGLISGHFIVGIDTLYRLIACLVLFGILVFSLPSPVYFLQKQRRRQYRLYTILSGVICIVVCFSVLLGTQLRFLWISSIPVFLVGLYLLLSGVNRRRPELYFLSCVSFVYAVVFLVVEMVPWFFFLMQQCSLLITQSVGFLLHSQLSLGASASGLWIILGFFVFFFVVFVFCENKKKCFLRVGGASLYVFFVWMAYLIFFMYVPFPLPSELILAQSILFLFCLPSCFVCIPLILHSRTNNTCVKTKTPRLRTILKTGLPYSLVLLFLFSSTLTIFFSSAPATDTNPTVLIYGKDMLGTWDIPAYGDYGQYSFGMFGLLPYYLNSFGYNPVLLVDNITSFLDTHQPSDDNITRYLNFTDYTSFIEAPQLTQDLLSSVDIFVVINLNTSFSQEEHDLIYDYLSRGGSLLVLGDHTDVGGIQQPLNDLLLPAGIQYRFDAALPLDSTFRWMTSSIARYHPSTSLITGLDELQISIGASLDISSSCFPLIIGKYGLSDEGNRSNIETGYLGDFKYNPGENLGDIILVAGSYYGNGKILAFGDTSSFQNSALPYSSTFLQGVFSWLTSEQTMMTTVLQQLVALACLSGSFLLVIIIKNWFKLALLFPIVLCLSLLGTSVLNPLVIGTTIPTGNIAYINVSHNERFSKDFFSHDSLNGLIINLMRNRYVPLMLKDFDAEKIRQSTLLIFNAPTKQFSTQEITTLTQYMQDGGILILTTGYEDKQASLPLLQTVGLDIQPVPLGPVPYIERTPEDSEFSPRFVDSYPITFPQHNTAYVSFYNFTVPGWEPTYHLMVFTSQQHGGLLLISDSQFLLDENLESLYDYWPGNILLLKRIFDNFQQHKESI